MNDQIVLQFKKPTLMQETRYDNKAMIVVARAPGPSTSRRTGSSKEEQRPKRYLQAVRCELQPGCKSTQEVSRWLFLILLQSRVWAGICLQRLPAKPVKVAATKCVQDQRLCNPAQTNQDGQTRCFEIGMPVEDRKVLRCRKT